MVTERRIDLVFYIVVALALLWVVLPWYPRMVLTLEIAIAAVLLVPVAYFMRKGNYVAYRILRSATWLMWIFLGMNAIFILFITKGRLSELNFGDADYLPENIKALGNAVVRGALAIIIAFVLNTICYFLLISKSVINHFRELKADSEQVTAADTSSGPR